LKNYKLPSEQQAEGLQRQRWRDGRKKRTAAHVSAAVEIKRPTQSTTSTDAETTELEFLQMDARYLSQSVLPEVLANDDTLNS